MIEVSRVSQWLETHIEGLRGPFEFNMIAGGRSNITYRVVDSAGKQVVLRSDTTRLKPWAQRVLASDNPAELLASA